MKRYSGRYLLVSFGTLAYAGYMVSRLIEERAGDGWLRDAAGVGLPLAVLLGGILAAMWLGERPRQKLTANLVLGVLITEACVLGARPLYREATRWRWRETARQVVAQVSGVVGKTDDSTSVRPTDKWARCEDPGLTVIDRESGRLHDSYFELAPKLRPSSMATVRAVVLVSMSTEQMGEYVSVMPGSSRRTYSKAYRHKAGLILIDLGTLRVVSVAQVVGSAPPREKQGYGNAYGSVPTREIADHIETLVSSACR